LETDEERKEEAKRRAEELVEGAKEANTEAESETEVEVTRGEPAETILEYAEKNDVNHSHGEPRR